MSLSQRRREAAEACEAWWKARIDLGALGGAGQAAAYSLAAGGKRFRPFLVREVSRTAGAKNERWLPLAAALELIHTYSLIHDDLPAMDDDDLRRGQPTCHRVHGEALAILAGDGLQALAFELLLSARELSDSQARRAARILAEASGFAGMVGGQAADMAATGSSLDRAALEAMHAGKTGALISAAARFGAIAGDCPPDCEETLARFGLRLGLLFQIADDLLDATASRGCLGKTPGKDARQGKTTFVSLLGLEGARQALAEEREKCSRILATLPYNTAHLAEIVVYVAERDA